MSSAPEQNQSVRSQPLSLLVFAGVPPPVHGQSVMVAALLRSLEQDPRFRIAHVDPRLSVDSADVGRGRPGKLFSLVGACIRALGARVRRGPTILYYVPAPGRRVPVFRDWIVMALCRPLFSGLVLHWHAVGLGQWTAEHASGLERVLTRRLLGKADLAITLAAELEGDVIPFRPKRLVAVGNGISDPLVGRAFSRPERIGPAEVLFLGLGSEEKGLFRTAEAVMRANAREKTAFRLTFAGAFPSQVEEARFQQLEAASEGQIRCVGFANDSKKAALLAEADMLCFPTNYAHEGQPLVLIEALAYDLPILTTRWRAIPGMLPPTAQIQYVDPQQPEELSDSLFALRNAGSPGGAHRRHFLEHFTLERHLSAMKERLLSLASTD